MNDEHEDAVAKLVRLAGPRPRPDAERTARVRNAVYEEWQRTTQRQRWTRYGIGTAIAATLAGVLLAVLLVRRTAPGRLIETRPGEVTSIAWSGATLRLDSGTRLRLDTNTHATLERGALFFASDKNPRVTIATPFGDVRDIGTRFELRLGDDALRVRVDEGIVDVRGERADAGTELVVTRERIARHAIAAPPRLIILEGRTLGDVIERAARAKGLRVEWHAERDVVLHGTMALTPDEAIDAATGATGTRYRIDGKRLIVSGSE